MQHSEKNYRWVILALLWLLYASFGLVMGSMSPLVTPVISDLDMSSSQMGLILGSWQLVYIVASIGAGNLIDRWRERKSILFGILVISLSACLRYFSNGFGTILLTVALLGVGGPMISAGGPKTISLWFEGKSRGMALGIYMTGASVGTLLGFALTNSIVMPLLDYSWRATFLIYGIFALTAGLLWGFLSRDVKSGTTANRMGIFKAVSQIVRIRNVQLVLILGLLTFATFHGLVNWLPRILETGGMSPALAGFAASAFMIARLPALIYFPHMIPVHFRGRSLALSALVTTMALGGVIGTSGAFKFIALVILGGAGSVFTPILLLVLMDSCRIPSEYLGSANGIFLCIAEVGGFLAPLVMGVLYDITESFLVGMLLLMALNLIMVPISSRIKIQTPGTGQARPE